MAGLIVSRHDGRIIIIVIMMQPDSNPARLARAEAAEVKDKEEETKMAKLLSGPSPGAAKKESQPGDAPLPSYSSSSSKVVDTGSLSSTIVEDVSGYVRLPLVFVNMVVMLLCLLGFWSSLYTLLTRSSVPPGAPARNFVVVLFERPEIPALFLSSVAFVTASFGFLGALRENVILLTVYVRLMTALAVLLVLLAVLAFFLPSAAHRYAERSVSRDMIAAYRDSAELQGFVDWMQLEYRCCGVSSEGFRDWNHNPYFACNSSNPSRERCNVPVSCCRKNETSAGRPPDVDCGKNVLQVSDQAAWARVNTRSCADALFSRMRDRAFPTSMLLLALCLATLLLVSLAIATREQVRALSAIYDVYYRHLEEGQEVMVARDTTGLHEARARCQGRAAKPPRNFWQRFRGLLGRK
ncbi:tetraspanin-33 [Dermacentor silvarum]|uniref:tetraspanin-33 n=1 Tax=Dermacentor silvarum TaxID=543639 RepID=UPI001898A0CA|nr:tetraspanin-33 [Dermacentor silvarum]